MGVAIINRNISGIIIRRTNLNVIPKDPAFREYLNANDITFSYKSTEEAGYYQLDTLTIGNATLPYVFELVGDPAGASIDAISGDVTLSGSFQGTTLTVRCKALFDDTYYTPASGNVYKDVTFAVSTIPDSGQQEVTHTLVSVSSLDYGGTATYVGESLKASDFSALGNFQDNVAETVYAVSISPSTLQSGLQTYTITFENNVQSTIQLTAESRPVLTSLSLQYNYDTNYIPKGTQLSTADFTLTPSYSTGQTPTPITSYTLNGDTNNLGLTEVYATYSNTDSNNVELNVVNTTNTQLNNLGFGPSNSGDGDAAVLSTRLVATLKGYQFITIPNVAAGDSYFFEITRGSNQNVSFAYIYESTGVINDNEGYTGTSNNTPALGVVTKKSSTANKRFVYLVTESTTDTLNLYLFVRDDDVLNCTVKYYKISQSGYGSISITQSTKLTKNSTETTVANKTGDVLVIVPPTYSQTYNGNTITTGATIGYSINNGAEIINGNQVSIPQNDTGKSKTYTLTVTIRLNGQEASLLITISQDYVHLTLISQVTYSTPSLNNNVYLSTPTVTTVVDGEEQSTISYSNYLNLTVPKQSYSLKLKDLRDSNVVSLNTTNGQVQFANALTAGHWALSPTTVNFTNNADEEDSIDTSVAIPYGNNSTGLLTLSLTSGSISTTPNAYGVYTSSSTSGKHGVFAVNGGDMVIIKNASADWAWTWVYDSATATWGTAVYGTKTTTTAPYIITGFLGSQKLVYVVKGTGTRYIHVATRSSSISYAIFSANASIDNGASSNTPN